MDEISAHELQERCKTCLIIESNDLAKTKEVLKENNLLGNHMENEGKLFMYDHFDDPALVNELLVKNGLKVSSLSFSGNGFEDYFIERLGK